MDVDACPKKYDPIREIALSLALVVLAPTLANTQERGALEDVLVTGAYSPQSQLSASVSVLDADQIRALNKRSIVGLLKTMSGLLVEEQGGPGGLTSISIRGAESNFTLVVVDGIPVNDPTNSRGGGFDFANINPFLVERIEVVRGAQSVIYGSDALAGVINIVTRRPAPGHEQRVFAELGEDDYSNVAVSALGRLGKLEYALELASRDEGESVEGSPRKSDNGNLRMAWQLTQAQNLSLSYHYLDGARSSYPEQSGGPDFAVMDALDESDYEDQVVAFVWAAQLTDRWGSNISASRFSHQERSASPGITPFFEVPPNAADTEFYRNKITWVNTLRFAEDLQFDMGADYRSEEGEGIGYVEYSGFEVPTDFELNRSTLGLFASASAKPVAGLLLQGSARYDDPDSFDSETSLGLGISYNLGRGFALAGNWGEAFKLPSFFALGHALVGNLDLKPELATSWDVGLAWDNGETLRLEAAYFSNDYRDLVDFDDETFRNVNRKKVETSGVELQGQWQASPELSFRAQLTYVDLKVVGEDSILTGRPEWTAGAVTQWRIHKNWHTTLNYQYTGEQWAASRHTGGEVTGQLSSFDRLDWSLRWQPSTDWQLILSADNLLDDSYETAVGFPAPGRSLRLGLQYSH